MFFVDQLTAQHNQLVSQTFDAKAYGFAGHHGQTQGMARHFGLSHQQTRGDNDESLMKQVNTW